MVETNALTEKNIECCIEVHRQFGPGLLESAYEETLCRELSLQKIPYHDSDMSIQEVNMNVSYSLAVILTMSLLGCSAPTEMETKSNNPEPIHLNGSQPIAFQRVLFNIQPGQEIGWHHDGIARVRHFNYQWQSGIFVGSDQYRIAASEEMRRLGYTVLGAENILFGQDESAKARFQLGGTVLDMRYNTYGPLAGGFSEAKIRVEWQVQDSLKKTIVYKVTTDGYGKQSGTSPGVVLFSFRNAFNQLLSYSSFAEIIKISSEEPLKLSYPDKIKIKPFKQKTTIAFPDDIEVVMQGIIVIKAGSTHASGFIISEDGYSLTAAHVVSGLREVTVKMRTGLELSAKVIRIDESQDIALIQIEGTGHKPVELGLGNLPPVGSELYAIGAPASESLSFSVSKGIVSGYRGNDSIKYLQTDASLNPGNSGGPLFDKLGRAVGIVSWKIVAPGFEGLSFGVPLDVVASHLSIEWTL
jgi:serine protease Do